MPPGECRILVENTKTRQRAAAAEYLSEVGVERRLRVAVLDSHDNKTHMNTNPGTVSGAVERNFWSRSWA